MGSGIEIKPDVATELAEMWNAVINVEYDKNIILYGPPGTGKTYSTAIFAVAICDGLNLESVKAINGDTYLPNFYIARMNHMKAADRSIALMDTALRRRFRFVEMMPDSDVLREIGADKVEDLDVALMLDKINERISFLYDREHTIGQAFFTKLAENPSIELLQSIFEKSVIPLLQEYFYEDYQKIQLVLGDNAKTDPATKFIIDEEVKVKSIFKGRADEVIDLPEKKYSINKAAFSNIESYKQII